MQELLLYHMPLLSGNLTRLSSEYQVIVLIILGRLDTNLGYTALVGNSSLSTLYHTPVSFLLNNGSGTPLNRIVDIIRISIAVSSFFIIQDSVAATAMPLLHPSPPRPVQEHTQYTKDDKQPADRPANDIVVLARRTHAVPELALWLRRVEDQREQLQDADHDGHDDGQGGQDDGVVQECDGIARVARRSGARRFRCGNVAGRQYAAAVGFGEEVCGGLDVEGEHEGAVEGVDEAHPG